MFLRIQFNCELCEAQGIDADFLQMKRRRQPRRARADNQGLGVHSGQGFQDFFKSNCINF